MRRVRAEPAVHAAAPLHAPGAILPLSRPWVIVNKGNRKRGVDKHLDHLPH